MRVSTLAPCSSSTQMACAVSVQSTPMEYRITTLASPDHWIPESGAAGGPYIGPHSGTTSHRTWYRSNRWKGQSGDDPLQDGGIPVLSQRSPDPAWEGYLTAAFLSKRNIGEIRPLVAGALGFVINGEAFVA